MRLPLAPLLSLPPCHATPGSASDITRSGCVLKQQRHTFFPEAAPAGRGQWEANDIHKLIQSGAVARVH